MTFRVDGSEVNLTMHAKFSFHLECSLDDMMSLPSPPLNVTIIIMLTVLNSVWRRC